MRKVLVAVAVGAVAGSAMLASAASRDESQPEARAYMNFNFGGARALPKNFHYGMRLDYDHRFVSHPMPPIVQMDFNSYGFSDARVNGLPFIRRVYALNQTEVATIPVAVGAGAGTAVAATTVVDWTLLAVGAAGLGVAGYQAADNAKSDETTTVASGGSAAGGSTSGSATGSTSGSATGSTSGSTTGGDTAGGSTSGGSTSGGTTGGDTSGGSTSGGSTSGGLLGFAEYRNMSEATRHTAEYQEWLDGGTGHMGDLAAAKK
jgi:hypothetical protein